MDDHQGRSDLETARIVMLAIKQRLPVDRFDVGEGTLFVSAVAVPPRAVFAVGLIGIPLGLIAVEFDIPADPKIDEVIEYAVLGLLSRNQQS